MEKQHTGSKGTSARSGKGIFDYAAMPLDEPLCPADIADITRLRKDAQARLRARIDADGVEGDG